MIRVATFSCAHCGTVCKMQGMYDRYHGDACKYANSADDLKATLMARANAPLSNRLKTITYKDYVKNLKELREKT